MWKRRLGIAVLAAAILLAVAMAGLLGTSERRLALLERIVASASPYSLRLQGAQFTLHPLRLRADLLQLAYPDPNTPPLLAIQQLDASVPVGRLLGRATGGGRFSARNVSYYLDGTGRNAPVDFEGLLASLAWLPERVDIGSVHLISRAENVWIFPLLHVSGQRTDSDAMAVVTQADIGQRRVVLEALLAWRLAEAGRGGLDVDAALFGPDDDSRLELHGRLEAGGNDLHYATTISGTYRRVSDFVRAFEPGAYPIDGNLHIEGELNGDLDGYELRVQDLSITTPERYVITAQGRVSRRGSAPAQLAFDGRGEASRIAQLLPLPPVVDTLLERSELRLGLTGTLETPVIERAAVELYGPGRSRVTLENSALQLPLAALRDLTRVDTTQLAVQVDIGDLPRLLAAVDVTLPAGAPERARLQGEVRAEGHDITAHFASAALEATHYRATGSLRALWKDDRVSLPVVDLTLSPVARSGRVHVAGSIADLASARGLVLDLALDGLDPALAFDLAARTPPSRTADARVNGTLRLLKAADTIWLRDIDAALESPGGLRVTARGNARPDRAALEADLRIELAAAEHRAWQALGLPLGPDVAHADLRLRPRYATLLGALQRGTTTIQAVANADLLDGAIAGLALDLYAPELRLDDFAFLEDSNALAASAASPDQHPAAVPFAAYPVHLTLRSDRLRGAQAGLDNLSIGIDGDAGHFLLRHFDSRYAGGELVLRGVADFSLSPPAFSIGGQGIRVPLAALTQDLGLQDSITGDLSLRGGLSTRGVDAAALTASLAGRIAVAVSETEVSGPAYDLLMTNLLAWLVEGSARKTTTFDCSMAQFDILGGVARTDSLYIETPRMVATGKGLIDLNAGTLDLRIEPRSRQRTFQFPSAVRLRGPLSAPAVSVSELQATADLSAQALLLLPSLTLKLFGIGGSDGAPRPCTPGAG